jgi:hypothetical protein
MARRTPHEPVLTATLLAPVVVWLAAYFGFDMDEAAATQIAGVVLLVGSLFARQRVRPLSKGPSAVEGFGAVSGGPARPPRPPTD